MDIVGIIGNAVVVTIFLCAMLVLVVGTYCFIKYLLRDLKGGK